ncbi:MAG: hypothetical protein MMC23_008402 [Stictis urceolatum]|nr:hypothetical protein [Stictis urceolata]
MSDVYQQAVLRQLHQSINLAPRTVNPYGDDPESTFAIRRRYDELVDQLCETNEMEALSHFTLESHPNAQSGEPEDTRPRWTRPAGTYRPTLPPSLRNGVGHSIPGYLATDDFDFPELPQGIMIAEAMVESEQINASTSVIRDDIFALNAAVDQNAAAGNLETWLTSIGVTGEDESNHDDDDLLDITEINFEARTHASDNNLSEINTRLQRIVRNHNF